jgi:hypothetical protein
MPERRTLHRIDKAAGDGGLVRVRRKKGWDRLDGWIVAHSRKWLLMAVELDAGFNGHTLIRPSDIGSIQEGPSAKFVQQSLAAEGHWPLPRLAGIDLTSTQTVLTSLSQIAPLVSIHYEQDHPDECLIGLPRDFRRRKFRLRTVNPTAEWDADDSTLRYRSVSRIDVGGAYARRLAAVAGALPIH